jgi:RecA-family ATPase
MVKALLKMEFDEFLIYNNAYFYNESSSYQNLDKNKQSYTYFLDERKSEDMFYFQNFRTYNELLNNEDKNQKNKDISTLMNFKLVINKEKDFSINWSTSAFIKKLWNCWIEISNK